MLFLVDFCIFAIKYVVVFDDIFTIAYQLQPAII